MCKNNKISNQASLGVDQNVKDFARQTCARANLTFYNGN